MGKERMGQPGQELVRLHLSGKISFLIPKGSEFKPVSWKELPFSHRRLSSQYYYIKEEGWSHFKGKSRGKKTAYLSLKGGTENNVILVHRAGLSVYNQLISLLPGERLSLRLANGKFNPEIISKNKVRPLMLQ